MCIRDRSEDDEDARQVEIVRLIVADHLWADCVHDVADQGHGGRDGCLLYTSSAAHPP